VSVSHPQLVCCLPHAVHSGFLNQGLYPITDIMSRVALSTPFPNRSDPFSVGGGLQAGRTPNSPRSAALSLLRQPLQKPAAEGEWCIRWLLVPILRLWSRGPCSPPRPLLSFKRCQRND
jgi:hypothetical protein